MANRERLGCLARREREERPAWEWRAFVGRREDNRDCRDRRASASTDRRELKVSWENEAYRDSWDRREHPARPMFAKTVIPTFPFRLIIRDLENGMREREGSCGRFMLIS